MKNRVCVTTLLLALILVFAIAGMPMAAGEANDEESTTATVAFLDGSVRFPDDIGGSGMNLNFGINRLPISAVAYTAVNALPANHIVAVEDARFNSGDWGVTVTLTSFESVGADSPSSFEAMIRFENARVVNANESAGIVGLTVGDPVSVTSNAGAAFVMTATSVLPRGLFSVEWTNDDITLNISGSEVLNISHDKYAATLNWALSVGPN